MRPIEVQIGLRDGQTTEVSGPEVKEGMEIVVGQEPAAIEPAGGHGLE
jgi:hypothetical protein